MALASMDGLAAAPALPTPTSSGPSFVPERGQQRGVLVPTNDVRQLRRIYKFV